MYRIYLPAMFQDYALPSYALTSALPRQSDKTSKSLSLISVAPSGREASDLGPEEAKKVFYLRPGLSVTPGGHK